MTTVSHSSLTAQQLEQVAYLFADDVFSTDAASYLYQLDGRGNVVTRCSQIEGQKSNTTRRVTAMRVTAQADTHISADQLNAAQSHMEALAVCVAEKLYQVQEVTHHE